MSVSKEVWKPIKGYEELYEVSNLGRVRIAVASVKWQAVNGNLLMANIGSILKRAVMKMSVSKWAYESWKCDGEFCVGDCSICYKAQIEQDGDVTWDGFTDDSERISETVSKDDGRG